MWLVAAVLDSTALEGLWSPRGAGVFLSIMQGEEGEEPAVRGRGACFARRKQESVFLF